MISLTKCFFLLCLLLIAPRSEAQTEDAASFLGCDQPGKIEVKKCLKLLLNYHCLRLAIPAWHTFYDEQFDACVAGSDAFAEALDFEQIQIPWVETKGVVNGVAFSTLTERAFRSEKVTPIIETIRSQFDESYRFNQSHSAWDTVLTIANGKKRSALGLMAVLFQDLAKKAYPNKDGSLYYPLYKMSESATLSQHSNVKANTKAYQLLMDEIHHDKIRTDRNPEFSLYPSSLFGTSGLSPMAHHFYVPAYASFLISASGLTKEQAAFAPMLFNTIYEMLKIDRKLNLGLWPSRYPDSLPLDPKIEINLEKIYTGYVGALFGLGLESKRIPYESFRVEFTRSPYQFLLKRGQAPF